LSTRGKAQQQRLEASAHGIVQGVFFRYSTRLKAEALGLVGTVANRPDGTVHVIAEGPRDQLEQLAAWLRVGSDAAVVERVDETWQPASGAFESFRIVR